jgi:drug/metabolite transporter (DMT)-like permease
VRSFVVPLLLSLFAAVLGAAANLLYKRAAQELFSVPLWKNTNLIFGLICFFLVLVLFISAFRAGGKLMLVYPAYATTYIWALVFSIKFEREAVSPWQIAGIVAIMTGVALIGWGARA